MPYIINSKTYALISLGDKTKVIENDKIFEVTEKTNHIVEQNCYYNCSTLDGRQKASSYLLGSSYKTPIILNEKREIILIPTHSSRNSKCNWLILDNILNYYPNLNKTVKIEFKNYTKIDVPISYSIFDRQVLRATRLESILRGRKNQKYL